MIIYCTNQHSTNKKIILMLTRKIIIVYSVNINTYDISMYIFFLLHLCLQQIKRKFPSPLSISCAQVPHLIGSSLKQSFLKVWFGIILFFVYLFYASNLGIREIMKHYVTYIARSGSGTPGRDFQHPYVYGYTESRSRACRHLEKAEKIFVKNFCINSPIKPYPNRSGV